MLVTIAVIATCLLLVFEVQGFTEGGLLIASVMVTTVAVAEIIVGLESVVVLVTFVSVLAV